MTSLLTKEHYALMDQFEREHSGRFDREDKALWPKGVIYQDGHVNELFLAYRRGYAHAKYVAYGDGFNDGLNKGFSDGYDGALADFTQLVDALEIARDYVAVELDEMRQAYRGHEKIGNVPETETDLAKIDAALSAYRDRQGRGW